MYATSTESQAEAFDRNPAAAPLGSRFLAHLRTRAGMSGVAMVASGRRWLEAEGAVPPADLPHDLFGPIGIATTGPDPQSRCLIVVPVPTFELDRPLWLVLWDSEARSALDASRLLTRVTELVAHAAMGHRRSVELQRLHLVERASQTARIGMWSCTLPDESLIWTDGVYDLFGLPRGAALNRDQIVRMYTPESADRLRTLRSHAIATLGDFHLDAEIITPNDRHRWIRITAAVDGVDGKARLLLGMKQDITEEKLLADRTRRLAETDVLTGLANRALFQSRLDDLHGQTGGVPVGALLLVDLDHFKSVNDELGHVLGDDCLVEAGRRLRQCCPTGTQVARIGGDEFAILTDDRDTLDANDLAQSIVTAFELPFVLGGQTRKVRVSVGVARREQNDADTIYRNADIALYRAKASGRGTWRVYETA